MGLEIEDQQYGVRCVTRVHLLTHLIQATDHRALEVESPAHGPAEDRNPTAKECPR